MPYFVEYREDGTVRQHWPLKCGTKYIVGRNKEQVNLEIPHVSMSRVHASVEVLKNGTLKVRDMKAPNGTLVNGTRVPVNGEVIAMLSSDTVIRFALNPCTYKVTESVPEIPSMSSPKEAQLAVGQRGPEVTEIVEAKPRGGAGGRHRPSASFGASVAASGSSPDAGRAGPSAATPPGSGQQAPGGRRAGSRWGVTATAAVGDTSGQ